MSINGTGMLCGILEANDGSIWFGSSGCMSGVYRMMERQSRILEIKRDKFIIRKALEGYHICHKKLSH